MPGGTNHGLGGKPTISHMSASAGSLENLRYGWPAVPAGELAQAFFAPQRNPSAVGTGASGLCGNPAGDSGRL